jgi:hypothetical protein
MFSTISENLGRQSSKYIFYGVPLKSNKTNYSLGRPEWQQEFTTTNRELHNVKKLTGNREIIDKDYLKPNYSGFKLIHFPQEKPFLTSNGRDFIFFNPKPEEKSKLNEEQLKFLRESKVKMGDHKPENKSIYGYLYEDPKKQVPRFNYNKINFKYNPYNVHPITQQLIWKDPKRMNPFDYYNKDKDKHYITNRNVSFINTEYRKVWDPITNRYFPGSVRCLSENKKNLI